jgi:hypothetical protein
MEEDAKKAQEEQNRKLELQKQKELEVFQMRKKQIEEEKLRKQELELVRMRAQVDTHCNRNASKKYSGFRKWTWSTKPRWTLWKERRRLELKRLSERLLL